MGRFRCTASRAASRAADSANDLLNSWLVVSIGLNAPGVCGRLSMTYQGQIQSVNGLTVD